MTFDYPDDFIQFWEAYPRKIKKMEALKAWNQVEKYRPPTQDLVKLLASHCSSHQWRAGFIPYPSTWLRGHQWEDVLDMGRYDSLMEEMDD